MDASIELNAAALTLTMAEIYDGIDLGNVAEPAPAEDTAGAP
jgi:hypothetical protein